MNSKVKYKPGMVLTSKTSTVTIELINRKSGNRHWNTRKVGSKKSHMVHEGTLDKYYEPLENK